MDFKHSNSPFSFFIIYHLKVISRKILFPEISTILPFSARLTGITLLYADQISFLSWTHREYEIYTLMDLQSFSRKGLPRDLPVFVTPMCVECTKAELLVLLLQKKLNEAIFGI